MENEKATILWDSPIITDRHVPCNKPDIVKQEKKSDRCQIIDVAIPSDYNTLKKYVGRIPGCHNIYSLQRSAILGTAHILRKVLPIKLD